MAVYSHLRSDSERKDAIVALVDAAADGGAVISAGAGPVTGALSLTQLQSALAVSASETLRLVNACLDDDLIAVERETADALPNTWRFIPAE